MIEAQDLVIGHDGSAILKATNLCFKPGEFVAIVGANGAGKTTLLRTLAGLLPAIGGNMRLHGHDLTRLSTAARARLLAYVDSETPVFGGMIVRDVIAMGRMPYRAWWQWTSSAGDAQAVDEALQTCGLHENAARHFSMLSSGERQRVWIAAAFAQSTATLLLDEPTSRLDIRYAVEVLRLLRRAAAAERTVVASMHDLERAALFADRIVVLGDGGIVADGAPHDTLTEAVLHKAYGVAIDVRREDGRIWMLPQR